MLTQVKQIVVAFMQVLHGDKHAWQILLSPINPAGHAGRHPL